jgi:Na+/H+ antiporter NhaA
MSLFITSSAFSDPSLQAMAKLSILIASLIAAVIGTIILLRTSPDHAGATELIPVVNSTDIAVN